MSHSKAINIAVQSVYCFLETLELVGRKLEAEPAILGLFMYNIRAQIKRSYFPY